MPVLQEQKPAHVQEVLYAGFAGAKTGAGTGSTVGLFWHRYMDVTY